LVVLLPGRQHGGQGQRDNMNTATNRDSRWMFPGRRAGQPMHPDALAALVNGLGIPTVAGRASAIRQHDPRTTRRYDQARESLDRSPA
jgi:hypothetical protein